MCFFRTVSIKFDLLETSSGHFTFNLKVIWGLPPCLYQLLNVMLSLSIVLCLSCIYCTLFHVDGRKETVTYQLEAKTLKLWQRYVIIDQYKVKVQATWAWDRDSSISQILKWASSNCVALHTMVAVYKYIYFGFVIIYKQWFLPWGLKLLWNGSFNICLCIPHGFLAAGCGNDDELEFRLPALYISIQRLD